MKIKVLCLLAIVLCFSCNTDDIMLENNNGNSDTLSRNGALQIGSNFEVFNGGWIYYQGQENFSEENCTKIRIKYNSKLLTELEKSEIRNRYTDPINTSRAWYLTAVEVVSGKEEYWYWESTNCPQCTGGVSDYVAGDPDVGELN